MQRKIVLAGGPGTGKSSVLEELSQRGFSCMKEISRKVTQEAQSKGIDQLFLKKPLLFSELLLEGRIQQFLEADKKKEAVVFFDRGIPDVEAYLLYAQTTYPKRFSEVSENYKYDLVFYFQPWEKIYESDNERYETFEQCNRIDHWIASTYLKYDYSLIQVPLGSIDERVDFILESIQ